jgi:hypothetical protein
MPLHEQNISKAVVGDDSDNPVLARARALDAYMEEVEALLRADPPDIKGVLEIVRVVRLSVHNVLTKHTRAA